MEVIPEGLVTKFTNFEPTGNPNVLKPTTGSLGSQYVRFFIHKEYSGADSDATGKEVRREIEMCEIRNDHLTKCAIRVKDLSPKQKRELAPLYERFKSQKDSKETPIADWDAAQDSEKIFLANMGVFSVEQLFSFSTDELYKLGPSGGDLHERARRHVQSKETKDVDQQKIELMKVLEEAKEWKERFQELERKMSAPAQKGRPKKTIEMMSPETVIQQAQEAS